MIGEDRKKTAAPKKTRGARRVKSRKARNENQLTIDFGEQPAKDKKSQKKKRKKTRSAGSSRHYILSHGRAIQEISQKMWASFSSTLTTFLVIGIVISLPTILFVFLKNANAATQGWTNYAQMTLYLKQSTPEKKASTLFEQLKQRKEFESVVFVSSDQGLTEFQKQTGMGDILSQLGKNPLPAAIVLTPKHEFATEGILESLIREFESSPSVLAAKLDFQWVRRLWAAIRVAEASVWMLTLLFGLTVLFVMGNTIRMMIEDQRREIELIKLIGGTNGFIRRPFLYMGVFLGGGAGIVAIIIVALVLWVLKYPVNDLFSQFNSQFELTGLSFIENSQVLLIGILLGLIGAWLVTTWNLKQIKPE